MLGALGSTVSALALAGPQILKWIKGINLAKIAQRRVESRDEPQPDRGRPNGARSFMARRGLFHLEGCDKRVPAGRVRNKFVGAYRGAGQLAIPSVAGRKGRYRDHPRSSGRDEVLHGRSG